MRLITLCLCLLVFVLPCYSSENVPSVIKAHQFQYRDVPDTLAFFFADEGPGSPGSPGTFEQGFNFESMEPAGWFAVDPWADAFHWHVQDVRLTAGHGTDMGAAIPFWPPDLVNDFALWCGDLQWPGYGSNWTEAVRVELGLSVSENLEISFAYAGSFEGDAWDYFDVFVLIGPDTLLVYHNEVRLEEVFQVIALDIPAGELNGTVEAIEFWFRSDGNTDDEYGAIDTDIGAVWLDNLIIAVDATVYIMEDFELGILPPGFEIVTDIPSEIYAALHQGVEVPFECWTNESTVWGFFDPETVEPGYPGGVIPYGPPYPLLMIQSPDLTVDYDGEPMHFRLDQVRGPYLSMDLFKDLYGDGDALLAWQILISARAEEGGLWGPWKWDNTTYYPPEYYCYEPHLEHIGDRISRSAGGYDRTITGIRLRIEVVDLCPDWCGIYGDGHPHTAGVLVDNVRVCIRNYATGLNDQPAPAKDQLHAVHPNPFNPRTEIRFELALPGRALLTVHDIAGRLLRTLADKHLEAGTHLESWKGMDDTGRALPSGVYFVRLETREGVASRKAVLIQ